MSRATDQSQRLSDTALTVDMHIHGLSIMPRWLRAVGGKTIDMPPAPLSKAV
ncbi:Putative dipeptidase [Mycobacteroides abscessus subsp. bolletii]|nr:Putative dipeptidase [Mycobacteroides abscessus subsp. bolletii]